MKTDFRDSLFGGAQLDATPGGPGYRCNNGTLDHVCFGRTGEQVQTPDSDCRTPTRIFVPPGSHLVSKASPNEAPWRLPVRLWLRCCVWTLLSLR